MSSIFLQLFAGGVLLSVIVICVGIPYLEKSLPPELLEKQADFTQLQSIQTASESTVPTLTVVERAPETEQATVREKVPEQTDPIPLAA